MESNRNPSFFLCCGEGGASSTLSHLMTISSTINNNNNHSVHFSPRHPNNEDYHDNSNDSIIKAKIMSHPQYPRLLSAYINCQKVGAPPEVVARLEEAYSSSLMIARASSSYSSPDPALDQFMEAYCEMLTKYEQELSKPFKEAMLFLSQIDAQFKSLSFSQPSLNQVY